MTIDQSIGFRNNSLEYLGPRVGPETQMFIASDHRSSQMDNKLLSRLTSIYKKGGASIVGSSLDRMSIDDNMPQPYTT